VYAVSLGLKHNKLKIVSNFQRTAIVVSNTHNTRGGRRKHHKKGCRENTRLSGSSQAVCTLKGDEAQNVRPEEITGTKAKSSPWFERHKKKTKLITGIMVAPFWKK